MTFRARIFLALGALALAPVLALGWLSYRANRRELLDGVGRAQSRAALEFARTCDQFVIDRAQGLHLASSYIPFDRLAGSDLGAVLAIPYRQLPDLTIVAALDRDGAALADAVAARPGEPTRALGGRIVVSDQDLDAFAHQIPLQAARGSSIAIGPPYGAPSGGPRVAIAARADERGDRLLVAELSLAELERRLRELPGSGGIAFLVDAAGRPFAPAPSDALGADDRALLATARQDAAPATRVVERGSERWLASCAPVATLGWSVVLAQPASAAFGPADRVRRYTLFWATAALAMTLVLGGFLARSLTRPVAELSRAADELRHGRYDATVDLPGGDELGQLAGAFNHMAREVARRDDEIRRWNTELQARVEARTAELRIAHEQVARSRRLAALGSLAAGVAHGLNNPMTSVVGLVSLARTEAGAASSVGELLGTALGEARRVTTVVDELRRLVAQERGEGARRFAVTEPVRAALEPRREALATQGISLQAELDDGALAVQGDPHQIAELVDHLVENALVAMPAGGRLGVAVAPVEGDAVALTVSDTGSGIPAGIRERIFDPFFTTTQRAGAGLGLTRAHAIAEAHHGSIRVESEEGCGTRFTVVFPAAPREAHLA